MTPDTSRLIRKKQLRTTVPYTPLRLEMKGRFPKRARVGENRVAWLMHEIEQWISERVSQRERPPAIG